MWTSPTCVVMHYCIDLLTSFERKKITCKQRYAIVFLFSLNYPGLTVLSGQYIKKEKKKKTFYEVSFPCSAFKLNCPHKEYIEFGNPYYFAYCLIILFHIFSIFIVNISFILSVLIACGIQALKCIWYFFPISLSTYCINAKCLISSLACIFIHMAICRHGHSYWHVTFSMKY